MVKVSDLPTDALKKYVVRLYKKVKGTKSMPAGTNLNKFIQDNQVTISKAIAGALNPRKKQKYKAAVSYVTEHVKGNKNIARLKQYRENRQDDDEWRAFNQARVYIEKLNKQATDNCHRSNCVRQPRAATLEKHGVYKAQGRFYSTVVDAYYHTHGINK